MSETLGVSLDSVCFASSPNAKENQTFALKINVRY
jgi:hypothetical protein